MRNALVYVLNNSWRHRDRRGYDRFAKRVGGFAVPQRCEDECSSALFFGWWRPTALAPPKDPARYPVVAPRTWLLTTGWRRYRKQRRE